MNRHFSTADRQVSNKHRTNQNHKILLFTGMARIKIQIMKSNGQDVERLQTSFRDDRNVKWYRRFGKQTDSSFNV